MGIVELQRCQPYGLEEPATVTHEKNTVEESKTQPAAKPQAAPFAL
jgi:hypothetical protein